MKKLIYYPLFLASLMSIVACKDDNTNPMVAFNSNVVQTADDFTDPRDGNTYRCVRIGDQIWMAENLRYETPGYSFNGCYTWEEKQATTDLSNYSGDQLNTLIAYAQISDSEFLEMAAKVESNPNYDWTIYDTQFVKFHDQIVTYYPLYMSMMGMTQSMILESMQASYPSFYRIFYTSYETLVETKLESSEEAKNSIGHDHFEKAEEANGHYSQTYGLLYSYEGAKAAVPDGWRLPSDEDWNQLEESLGMSREEIEKTEAWRGAGMAALLNEGGESHFNAKRAGANIYVRGKSEEFQNKDRSWYYWSSTRYQENDSTSVAMIRMSAIYSDKVWRGTSRVNTGYRDVLYSVRCVKDFQ